MTPVPAKPKLYKLMCPDCDLPMALRFSHKSGKWFYGCPRFPECRRTRGCSASGLPIAKSDYPSTPCDQPTRDARMAAHRAFDVLWRSGRFTRTDAYRQLQKWMGMNAAQAHIGRFDKAQCEKLLGILAGELERPLEED